jgi:hypothetical protein
MNRNFDPDPLAQLDLATHAAEHLLLCLRRSTEHRDRGHMAHVRIEQRLLDRRQLFRAKDNCNHFHLEPALSIIQ